MSTAEALRNQGQQQATNAADPRVILAIDAAIAKACKSRVEFSANDIREQFPTARNGLVGARVDAARKRGEMVAVGFERSDLDSTRGAFIKTWVGTTA